MVIISYVLYILCIMLSWVFFWLCVRSMEQLGIYVKTSLPDTGKQRLVAIQIVMVVMDETVHACSHIQGSAARI